MKFTCEKKKVVIRARKKVIVTVDAFQSSKLLKLLCIDSADLLESLSINIIVDNSEVEENLQDHLMTEFSFEIRGEVKKNQ